MWRETLGFYPVTHGWPARVSHLRQIAAHVRLIHAQEAIHELSVKPLGRNGILLPHTLWQESSQGELTFARIALLKPCFLPRLAGLVAPSIKWDLMAPLLTGEKYLHQEIVHGLCLSELNHSKSACGE